jgi:hypothetical protein
MLRLASNLLCSLDWLQTQNPPASASQSGEIAGVCHYAQLLCKYMNFDLYS